MVYLGNDEIESENQIGSIRMDFDNSTMLLYYKRTAVKSNPSIKFGDTIFLTDKDLGPIYFPTKIEMHFNLFRGAYNGSFKVAFEPFDDKVWCEEHMIRSVEGTGEIRVVFGGLSNATVAKLKINISGATNIHGIIAARNSQLDQPSCTSVLFWKSSANKIEVGCDGAIPLSRSRVGVSLSSVLYVDIALHIDGEIYKYTATFVPQITRDKPEKIIQEIVVPGKKTKISVTIMWDSREDYVYSSYDSDEYDSDEDTEGSECEN